MDPKVDSVTQNVPVMFQIKNPYRPMALSHVVQHPYSLIVSMVWEPLWPGGEKFIEWLCPNKGTPDVLG